MIGRFFEATPPSAPGDTLRRPGLLCFLGGGGVSAVYASILDRGGRGVRSPVDSLDRPMVSGVIGGSRIAPQ